MDLLLEVDDVFIGGVDVGVVAQLTWGLLSLVLSAEIHRHGRLIACVIAKGATTSEIGTAFQIAASYRKDKFKFERLKLRHENTYIG